MTLQQQLMEDILRYWQENKIFEQSVLSRAANMSYMFYDGPPFPSGDPHYGHLLQSTVKDLVPRWMTMRGYRVQRRRGWDCHGIPAENAVNKELGITSRQQVEEEFGIQQYVEECRKMVNNVNDRWKRFVDHVGRWVDMERPYFTMDINFMEAVIGVFSVLYSKNLIYKGFKVLGYSTGLGTALSHSEIAEGYEDRQDPAVTIRFGIVDADKIKFVGNDIHADAPLSLLAWTTTPWTLPANMFLAVHPDITYSLIFDPAAKECFVLAKNLLPKFYKAQEEYVYIRDVQGKELVGLRYKPLFQYYYQSVRLNPEFHNQVHTVLSASFVTDSDGTGIAHEAPAFGEDDYELVASVLPKDRAKERLFCPVDEYGQFTDEVPERHGRNVIECNADIIKYLKQVGLLVKQETIVHSYPHCPRTGLPLIYRAIESWFVKEDELKAKTVPATDPLHFVPAGVKTRFVNGLQAAPDRNISRTRFWGAPLPVWEPETGDGEPFVLGSLEEIYQATKRGSKNISKHIFVRHAQGTHNTSDVRDDFAELTPFGRGQAATLGEELKSYLADSLGGDSSGDKMGEKPIVLISPMQRCFQTILPYLSTLYSEVEIEQITQEYYKIHDRFEQIDGDIVTYLHDSATQKRYPLYGNVYVDFRLLEIMAPALRGEKQVEVMGYPIDSPLIEGGESVFDVERRIKAYLADITKEFPTQVVVHASHWTPSIVFEKQMYDFPYTQGEMHGYKNAEWRVYYYDTDRGQGVDLHKPYVDAYWFEIDGTKYKRIPEVLDCWFESGSMPYGEYHQVGKPLQCDRKADFIAEGLDQTRGWFRSLHVLSTALQEQRTFDNVVVTGMILAQDGKKMSKSKKNYPDPTGLLEQYGADAFRLYVLNSPVVRGEPLRFAEKGVEQVLKDVVIPLENVWKFFATYAQVDEWKHPGTQVWFMRHAHAEESAEEPRTKDTPLTERGCEEISTAAFRESVHRIHPDVIVVSDFVRAQQTAQRVKEILREDLQKDVEIVVEEGLGLAGTPETVEAIYTGLTQKYAGKRLLLVSHNLRFRYLWAWLFGIEGDMKDAAMKQRYGIANTQVVPLPLFPIRGELDQWLYAELHQLLETLDELMQSYYLDAATKVLTEFVDKLSNRYVRRSRRRFWSGGMDSDKYGGYYTLFEVIKTYITVMAPFAPFVTEHLRQEMKAFVHGSAPLGIGEAGSAHSGSIHSGSSKTSAGSVSTFADKDSVHLEYRPFHASVYINHDLMDEIATVRKVITGALFLRAKNKIKVKQPLQSLKIQI